MIKFISGIFAGATYHFRAIALLIRRSELRSYVLIPILVNFVVGITLYLGLLIAGVQGIDTLIANLSLPNWASANSFTLPILEWLLRLLFGLILLVCTGFLLVQFGVVLGAPWYGILAEKLEQLRLNQLPPTEPSSPINIVRDIKRALLYEFKKLLLIIFIGVPLFIVGFIPPLGTLLSSIGGIALSATIVCLDFFDAPLERRRLKFRTKLSILRRSLPASATFALISLFLISIPIINLLSIPLCVTAGTLFFCDRIWPQLQEDSKRSP